VGRFVSILVIAFLLGPSAATPMGLAFNLSPPAAFLAVVAGVCATFATTLFAMDRIKRFVARRRPDRVPRPERGGRAARRARAVLDRFGPMGLGLVGPALFGTWVSAAVGAAVGMARRQLFVWLVVGATVWTGLLVLASDTVLGWLFG
jgi:uncharacterized membrane protein